MEIFAWKDKFSVDVAEMDRQHKRLLEYFSEIQTELSTGNCTQKAEDLLSELAEYCRFHFAEEERLLKSIRSPELEFQVTQHSYFLDQIREETEQFRTGALPGKTLVALLRDWFINHITFEDKKYGKLLSQGKALA